MTFFKSKAFWWKFAVVICVFGLSYLVATRAYDYYNRPCANPVTYSIGTFDSQFGISQADFLSDVAAAAQIWDGALNRQLFEYSPTAAQVKINLVYDSRQAAANQLTSLGYTIANTKSSYDSLQAHYNSLVASYQSEKAALDTATANFQTQQAAYEKEVDEQNSQGGASPEEASRLNAEYSQLNTEATSLQNEQASVNALVNQINPLVDVLNNLASELKLNVSNYNTIGSSQGEEFEEGNYVQDSSGRSINVYEFADQKELVRLLAHELGHSLGLEHVTDPDAIMYRLMDESQPNVATTADLNELKSVCHVNS